MVYLLQTTSKTTKFDKEAISIPNFDLKETRSIIYWWIFTQLIGYAVYRVFLFVYKVLDIYNNGHSSIQDYMKWSRKSKFSNFYTPSADEYNKFSTDPHNILLDFSFLNKVFKFALVRNSIYLDSISIKLQDLTNERNLLSHNRLPSISFEELEIRIKVLTEKFNEIINAASAINPEDSKDMKNLQNIVIGKIISILKKQKLVEQKLEESNNKDSISNTKKKKSRFPKINSQSNAKH
ncbi:UNVERIFIED_CONTAM: hypothetical protein RMT77_015696 [Armadillidium vulgare]